MPAVAPVMTMRFGCREVFIAESLVAGELVLASVQCAPRTSRPGRAPVSTPSRRVTTPLTIVAV